MYFWDDFYFMSDDSTAVATADFLGDINIR